MPALQIRVFDRQQVVFNQEFNGPVELGRQSDSQEEVYSSRQLSGGRWRVAVARLDEDTLSRRHALLEPLEGDRARLTNVSAKVPIRLADGSDLAAGASRELALPTVLVIGRKTVRVQGPERQANLRALPQSILMAPGQLSMAGSRFPTLTAADSIEIDALVQWLQTTMGVLQATVSSSDFFQKAAQAVVDIVGCDTGRVLLLERGEWKPVVVYSAPKVTVDPNWRPSTRILERVREEKRTCWQTPDPAQPQCDDSLLGVDVAVAAPILDRAGEVVGAIYGDCRHEGPPVKSRITELEAVLVELLASGVATGMARIEQEKAALEADVRFGQFFTRELSRQLALQPDLLKGRDSEVSILFCDIRAFSRISEKLGPAGTVEWINDVMGTLSDCVMAHRGVLVDYIGDELMAMWGAPEEQPDHARLACHAALDMLNQLPKLNERWHGILGESLNIGIGVNTGSARVGNTGSRHKFKYGPLGHTVNLASRVQGATKYLRSRLLITELTQTRLGDDFDLRRLCQVRVVNIASPVSLFELVPHGLPDWPEVKARYETALTHFEKARFREAASVLSPLLSEHSDDGPALVLMSRVLNHLVVAETNGFDPVWDLPGK